MKNWLPPLFGSLARAKPTVPRSNGTSLNSAGRGVAGGAGARARRVTTLSDEAGKHAVERHAVIVALAREEDERVHRLQRDVRPQLNLERALGGLHNGAVLLVRAYRDLGPL